MGQTRSIGSFGGCTAWRSPRKRAARRRAWFVFSALVGLAALVWWLA